MWTTPWGGVCTKQHTVTDMHTVWVVCGDTVWCVVKPVLCGDSTYVFWSVVYIYTAVAVRDKILLIFNEVCGGGE